MIFYFIAGIASGIASAFISGGHLFSSPKAFGIFLMCMMIAFILDWKF